MSRIVVVGATGTIGSAVVERLEEDHHIVAVGHSSGQLQVDLGSKGSIEELFGAVGEFDHLVSAAGVAEFGKLDELSDEDFRTSLDNKLMGQVNLVRLGHEHIFDGGSFTLTGGILARKPTAGSCAISMANAGLEGFVRAASLELVRDLRVNVVSPGWVAETLEEMGRDPSEGIPAAEVAEAYAESIDSRRTGEVIEAV